MTTPHLQIPSLVLPAGTWTFGTETELLTDLVVHQGITADVRYLQEKMVHVIATEIVAVGAPGNLLCWIEISSNGVTWGAIGGGGGVLPAIVPIVEVGIGVNLTIHEILLPWAIHSVYCRIVAQCPVNAGLPGDFWAVQGWLEGKGV